MKKQISYSFVFIAFVFSFLTGAGVAIAFGECSNYGYMANYNSLTGKCECPYGYVFRESTFGGDPQCESLSTICHDELGYSSRYNSAYGRCECNYGYVIRSGRCQDVNTVCSLEHGFHSEYDSLSNTCDCRYGYVMNNMSQCVEKQNNVYFYLKEVDDSRSKAIVTSAHDWNNYLVEYGPGCLSIENYLDRNLVMNLGTDFTVDLFDKIVLPDEDQTCYITNFEEVSSSKTLAVKKPEIIYVPKAITSYSENESTKFTSTVSDSPERKVAGSEKGLLPLEVKENKPVLLNAATVTVSSSSGVVALVNSDIPKKESSWLRRLLEFFWK